MKKIVKSVIFLILCILIISPFCLLIGLPYANIQEYNVVELMVFQDNDKTLYKATTDDGNTLILENEDLFLIGKTDSSSFGALLKSYEGKCDLKIITRGYRIPLFSAYQNIVEVVKYEQG